jgi:hypothetical protein
LKELLLTSQETQHLSSELVNSGICARVSVLVVGVIIVFVFLVVIIALKQHLDFYVTWKRI